MHKAVNKILGIVIRLLTIVTLLALAFVIYFIVHEALPLFQETSVGEFLFGQRWMPVDYTGETSFGIFNFIVATLYVSFVAMVLAILIGIGAAIYLSCVASERARSLLYPFIDLLAGIPSVIYGFIGLVILVKAFIRAGHPSGTSVLTAGILLAVMILPFLVSSISDTMLKLSRRYLPVSQALGIDKWYTVAHVILPLSVRSIWTGYCNNFMFLWSQCKHQVGADGAVSFRARERNIFCTEQHIPQCGRAVLFLAAFPFSAASFHHFRNFAQIGDGERLNVIFALNGAIQQVN